MTEHAVRELVNASKPHHLKEHTERRVAGQLNGATRPSARPLVHLLAEDLDDVDQQFDDELVEGRIGRNAMAVLYGDSNTGKTFFTFELSACIGAGEEFLGKRTARGLVLYLATEAAASVLMRARARQRRRGKASGLVIVTSPVNLFHGTQDVEAIVALVKSLEAQLGAKVVLIVGDTLARISAGANENSGEDMGLVLQRADAVRQATGATFLWVHHCGKDAAKGMRGWSGMRAAVDTEIEITFDEATGIRTAEITKQRDLSGKGERIGFRLVPVPLGVNRWGTERTSCVVVPAEAPDRPQRGKRPSEIAGAISEFLRSRGTGCAKGALVKHFEGQYAKQSVYREIQKMVAGGLLFESAGVVALPGKPGSAA